MNHVAARTLVMASLAALCTGAYAAGPPGTCPASHGLQLIPRSGYDKGDLLGPFRAGAFLDPPIVVLTMRGCS